MLSRILRACAGALLCVACSGAGAATGDWDHAFGLNGRVSLTANMPFSVSAWGLQPDGKIVVAGHPQTSEYLLARFNADGTLDPTFDGDGLLLPTLGSNATGNLDLKLLPDGRLLFAAQANGPTQQIKVLRRNADGSPDTSFGVNGELVIASVRSIQKPRLTLAPDGSAIIAATLAGGSADPNIVVARVLANGTLDASFGTAGLAEVGSPSPDKEVYAVAVQADGAIVVGGRLGTLSDPEAFVARLTSAGQLDGSFGSNGIAALSVVQRYAQVDRVAITADGKIFASGIARDLNDAVQGFVARLNTNGEFDASFGSAGRIIVSGVMHSMLVEPDGKLVAAGWIHDLAPGVSWLARYNTDGSPDVTFGLRGRARADFSQGATRLRVIDSQIRRAADGSYRSLLAIAPDAGPAGYAVARFIANGASPAVIGLRSAPETTASGSILRLPEGITRQITIYRSGGTEGTVSVQYRMGEQSARAGEDFVEAAGTVTFNDGETSKQIDLRILDDSLSEPLETFYLELFAPTGGAVLSRSLLNVQILFDGSDAGSTISFLLDSTQTKESTGPVTLLVQRTGDLRVPLTIEYATVAGTATGGADFMAGVGGVGWAANEGGARTITIPIVDDGVVEADEQFSVALSSTTPGVILDDNAIVRIADDDDASAAPTLSFMASTTLVAEAALGVPLQVNRMGDPSQAVSATWSTSAGFGPGVATAGADYVAASGTVSWSAGDTSPKMFTVPLLGDDASESMEIFTVTIVAASPAANHPGGGTVNVAIIDDDPAPLQPTVSVGPGLSFDEGAGVANIPLTMTGVPGNAVNVRYIVRAETATSADVTIASGLAIWDVGDTRPQQVSIPIVDDALDEFDETFSVTLSPEFGGVQIGTASARFTIVDNDPTPAGQNLPAAPGVQLSATSVTVGESERSARLTVTRVSGEFDVRYTVTGIAASDPADFIASSGTLSWANGDAAAKTFEIHINGDAQAETTETLDVVFTPMFGAFQGPPATASVAIIDDDQPDTTPARVEFVDTAHTVNESATSVTLQVVRTGNTTIATSVDYATVAGSATSADYTTAFGTLTWGANDNSIKLITITLVPDADDEADESFTVQLRNVSSGTELGAASASVSIVDDDAPAANPPAPDPSTPPSGGGGGGGGGNESLVALLLWAALVRVRRAMQSEAA